MLTPTTLKKILPNCQYPQLWVRPLNDAMRRFEINTPARVAAFLAQLAVESQELNKLEENLSYAPGRLTAVWPKRFPNADLARPYSRNPEKLANAVYAGRLGNGDEASRDGYRFRGRGLIQVTGRANYAAIGKILDVDLINMPDTLFEPRYAALSAGAFWAANDLNKYADDGDLGGITYRVTGSRATVEERKRYYETAKGVLTDVANGVGDVEAGPRSAYSNSGKAPRSKDPAREQTSSWFE